MKLSTLAKKANALPDIEFEWPGLEHFSDYNFEEATKSPELLRTYVNGLRQKMATYSIALQWASRRHIAKCAT
jgi:hypothetical protein